MSGTVILGAGMAGLGAAHRLRAAGVEAVVFDKNLYPGGHAATFRHGDFLFDDGPHISFTKDRRLQELFADSVDGRFEVIQTRVNNHWRGHWIKHPAQCNLHGLPEELVIDVMRDFVEAESPPADEIDDYAQWLLAAFGRTFAETFPMRYGRKYHTTTADNMTTDWLGPRLYRPRLEEVLRGALSPETADVHYVNHFRYPSEGGFVAFLRRFIEDSRIELGREVAWIDPVGRTLSFTDGGQVPFESLISSLPLPELIARIEGAPAEVTEAAGRLACTTCVVVNVGIDRAAISDSHWTYFYDDDYFFTRLSFPHMLSPGTVPPGAGSIQAEVYYSAKYRPMDRRPEECIEPVVRDLRRCGLLREDDRILHRNAALVPYANIIFDHDRPAALATVLGYLEELGIASCGRYGRWGYHWTDESFTSGEKAAQRILDR
jgi:protoporphyrinogen oxidase